MIPVSRWNLSTVSPKNPSSLFASRSMDFICCISSRSFKTSSRSKPSDRLNSRLPSQVGLTACESRRLAFPRQSAIAPRHRAIRVRMGPLRCSSPQPQPPQQINVIHITVVPPASPTSAESAALSGFPADRGSKRKNSLPPHSRPNKKDTTIASRNGCFCPKACMNFSGKRDTRLPSLSSAATAASPIPSASLPWTNHTSAGDSKRYTGRSCEEFSGHLKVVSPPLCSRTSPVNT